MKEAKRKVVDEGGRKGEIEFTVAQGDKNMAEVGSVPIEEQAEGDMTVVQLSLTPPRTSGTRHESIQSSDNKEDAPLDRKERRVKVRKRYADSKIKRRNSEHDGRCICCKKKEPEKDSLMSPVDLKTSALIRAEEVQSNLETNFPSFFKSLGRSNVNGCFWMGLPGSFCRANLPHEDTVLWLVDEEEKEYHMKYVAHKNGIGAGWRQFVTAQQLLEGDVLVFQLIDNSKLKVYIIRANDFSELDGALGLLNLDAPKQNDSALKINEDSDATGTANISSNKRRKRRKSPPLTVVEEEERLASQEHPNEQSDSVGSEVLEEFKLVALCPQFGDIRNFEDFNIVVDGAILDSQFSEEIRGNYYKLCCSQSSFLHGNLMKGLSGKLVVGIITEVVHISDAMKSCTLFTSREEFGRWEKALKGSEIFGMAVGFMLSRLEQLVSLSSDSENARIVRRFIEARNERDELDKEISKIEAQLQEYKTAYETCVSRMETLKSRAEAEFQDAAGAPWSHWYDTPIGTP